MAARVTRFLICVLLAFAAAGCTTTKDTLQKWFGTLPAQKPAELVAFKPAASAAIRWQGSIGDSDRYVFTPSLAAGRVYAAGNGGQIAIFDAATGRQLARFDTKSRLTGGVGADGSVILVGTSAGEVLAFDASGKPLWKTQLTSEVLSAPQASFGTVVVRSGDGRVFALNAASGARLWVYQRSLPALTVRTNVGVLISRDRVYVGFPGGRLVALGLVNGNVAWETPIALPKGSTELERIADLSSLPVIDGRQICAAAYQGRVACVDLLTGNAPWGRDISSVSGIAIDERNVYVSDDKSAIVAFDKTGGASVWKQDKLYGRLISGPVIAGRYIAVGDLEGYVHFMSAADGSFVARIATDGSPITAQPMALDDGVLVQTRKGGVFAITIR